MSSSLGRTAARGVVTTGSGQIIRLLLQVASVVVLARLITPAEYGLVAMVTMTRSNSRSARSRMSMWPLVMGSNVPG